MGIGIKEVPVANGAVVQVSFVVVMNISTPRDSFSRIFCGSPTRSNIICRNEWRKLNKKAKLFRKLFHYL